MLAVEGLERGETDSRGEMEWWYLVDDDDVREDTIWRKHMKSYNSLIIDYQLLHVTVYAASVTRVLTCPGEHSVEQYQAQQSG